jgi:2-keto-3-deoxy-L-rhamnonate aldolase RhmA
MASVRNLTKERLEAGGLALGVGLRQARTVDIAKAMRTAGFDWLFLDMEHSTIPLDTVAQISCAAQDAGITPIVRVPGFEHYHLAKALDGGAQGVVVPHVDTAEQATVLAGHCRYPPRGHRSVTGTLPQIDFQSLPIGEATEAIDAATLLVVMIETEQALANVEAIAAVPGVDVLLVGVNDLCLDLGMPGQVGDARIGRAFERIVAACRAHGKHAGFGGVADPALIERYVGLGMRLVLVGNDLGLMMAAGRARVEALRAVTPG